MLKTMAGHLDKFNTIYEQAMRKASHLEPWNGHYLTRKVETEILAGRFDFDKNYVGLELGCGNAFQATLLAALSKRIFATDLFDRNGCTHSVGITKAQDLVNKLKVDNITLISCSATALPFSDNYFDFIFSSSVLEHIADKKLALLEIERVLKPNGHLILIVPTHIPSIYAFAHSLLYILARVSKLFISFVNKPNNEPCNNKGAIGMPFVKRFAKHHPSFPMPEPHGAYRNVFQEFYQQSPVKWVSLINGCGFKVRECFSTCLVPWLLIEPFSTKAIARLYSLTKKINISLSFIGALKYISYLMGIIAVKDTSDKAGKACSI